MGFLFTGAVCFFEKFNFGFWFLVCDFEFSCALRFGFCDICVRLERVENGEWGVVGAVFFCIAFLIMLWDNFAMDRTLLHLPKEKQDELGIVKDIILEVLPDVRMIVLFGSYARGDWVEDVRETEGATHVYLSDFDILVGTKSGKVAEDITLLQQIDDRIEAAGVKTPCGIIYHSFGYVKEMIMEGHYFFTDIQKEGVYLFRTSKRRIGAIKTIEPAERRRIAEEHFDLWMEKAKEFCIDFNHAFERESYNKAAFELHQATECFYSAISLVFINYRFRTHELKLLNKKAVGYDAEFAQAFPQETDEERRIFKLLCKAYIDARYKKTFAVTKEELEKLAGSVGKLEVLAERICRVKIEGFV